MERKVGLLKMSAFSEDGELLSPRPTSPFLEESGGFIDTQEAAEQKGS